MLANAMEFVEMIGRHTHTHTHTHTYTHTHTHMHMWAAGCGRDASPVHSLAVVLRGRNGDGRRYRTSLQCEQSCREVMYRSERYCFG